MQKPSKIELHCSNCEIRPCSMLNTLDETGRNVLDMSKNTSDHKKGQMLFQEGERPLGIYCIRSGKVKVFKRGLDGKEQLIHIVKGGDLLGVKSLMADEENPVSAQTLEDSRICFLPKDDFLFTLEKEPGFFRSLFKQVCREMNDMTDFLVDLAQRPVRERVAISLLMLIPIYRKEGESDDEVVIDLPRFDLANLVGTANETLARLLHDMKEEGIVEIKGRKLKVKDPKAMNRIGIWGRK